MGVVAWALDGAGPVAGAGEEVPTTGVAGSEVAVSLMALPADSAGEEEGVALASLAAGGAGRMPADPEVAGTRVGTALTAAGGCNVQAPSQADAARPFPHR